MNPINISLPILFFPSDSNPTGNPKSGGTHSWWSAGKLGFFLFPPHITGACQCRCAATCVSDADLQNIPTGAAMRRKTLPLHVGGSGSYFLLCDSYRHFLTARLLEKVQLPLPPPSPHRRQRRLKYWICSARLNRPSLCLLVLTQTPASPAPDSASAGTATEGEAGLGEQLSWCSARHSD